ncbi:MAG: LuxR C-terminal-related transcriptional regulator [Oceanococcus sp.]
MRMIGQLSSLLQGYGFSGHCLIIDEPRSLGVAKNLIHFSDQAWFAHYFKHGLVHADPVLLAARQGVNDFLWRSDANVLGAIEPDAPFLAHARRFGYANGLTVSLHVGRFGMSVLTGMVAAEDTAAIHLDSRKRAVLRSRLQRLTDRVLADWGADQKPKIQLNPRECEVLSLSAQGRTTTQISSTLALCDATVRYHVKSACDKLQARNRTEAVVTALALGLIGMSLSVASKSNASSVDSFA